MIEGGKKINSKKNEINVKREDMREVCLFSGQHISEFRSASMRRTLAGVSYIDVESMYRVDRKFGRSY